MRNESGRPARTGWRLGALARRARWLAALIPALLIADAAHAASLMNSFSPRVPTDIGPRGPTLNTVGPRLDPSLRTTPGSPGANNQGGSNAGNNTGGSTAGSTRSTKTQTSTRRTNDNGVPPPGELRYVPDEVVIEVNGNPSDQQLAALFSRFHLTRLDTRRIGLINTTFFLVRINDHTSVPAKIRALTGNGLVHAAQPNYLFGLVQATANADATAAEAPDPSQYAIAKLRLDEAHRLALGDHVRVAVIDSGIDTTHPALAGV